MNIVGKSEFKFSGAKCMTCVQIILATNENFFFQENLLFPVPQVAPCSCMNTMFLFDTMNTMFIDRSGSGKLKGITSH